VPTRVSSAFVASTLNSQKVETAPPGPSSKLVSGDRAARRGPAAPALRDPLRIGFVVQRCGREVNGGAESLCLQIAQRMAPFWTTEILTTCALDYMTWENFYPPGSETVGSTVVRRFPVDRPRDVATFDKLSAELHSRRSEAALVEQEDWMRAQGPMSSALLGYLQAQKQGYDAFIFFGYLYATTYFGLPLVAEKAWLEPLAHDEWPIYFNFWDPFFARPRGFIFNTESEREFLRRRFPDNALAGPVAGIGIDPPAQIQTAAFRARYEVEDPFLLYVGRVDESKGCAHLFDYFIRWKQQSNNRWKLLILGQEVMPIPFHDEIIHLGYVSEEEKWAALSACDWLVMPSPHESLSIALLEAWSVGRPALVNGECAVLTAHCQQARGGLWYHNFAEWSTALSTVNEQTKQALGREGRRYVQERYSWARIEQAYLGLMQIAA
jgi:glycosyltransferase involved in cell wall biosynthesis